MRTTWAWAVLLFLVAIAAFGDDPATSIRVDQLGYPRDVRKLAVVAAPRGDRFTVNRVDDGTVVFEGVLDLPAAVHDSGETIRIADFSAIHTDGTYELRIDSLGKSLPFKIREQPYASLLRLVMRGYYGQRCGTSVDLRPDFPGYAHSACHLAGAYHQSSGRSGPRASTRGWHDAGDYGRYLVTSGISTGSLLWAWELFPGALREVDLAIPESGNGVPDFLDEVRWSLEWMLSMQDEDGGVWPKQTSKDFADLTVGPAEDPTTSFVVGTGSRPFKSSCATGQLGAAMAIAARVFAPFDPAFAARARDASIRAWSWLEKNPDSPFLRNPRGVVTGDYVDRNCRDERLWAAAELWRTTGDGAVGRWLAANVGGAIEAVVAGHPPSWRDVGAMAAWTYALSGRGEAGIVSRIRERSRRAADRIVERSRAHPYAIPLETDDYVWGSNGVAANYGLQLLVAHELEARPAYREAALEIVHYLLGRNPFAISWVTGAGSRPVMHPHHAPSVADAIEAPWPGLLAGGPNRNRQDPVLRSFPRGTPAGTMYLDAEESYAGNEIAINWNAPLVFILAGIMDE